LNVPPREGEFEGAHQCAPPLSNHCQSAPEGRSHELTCSPRERRGKAKILRRNVIRLSGEVSLGLGLDNKVSLCYTSGRLGMLGSGLLFFLLVCARWKRLFNEWNFCGWQSGGCFPTEQGRHWMRLVLKAAGHYGASRACIWWRPTPAKQQSRGNKRRGNAVLVSLTVASNAQPLPPARMQSHAWHSLTKGNQSLANGLRATQDRARRIRQRNTGRLNQGAGRARMGPKPFRVWVA
jgi:hypothetical protein